jgi:hypothetical protein
MSSIVKKSSSSTFGAIEAVKQEIQKTIETLQMTNDSIMKPVLTKLLKDQTQHLSELKSKAISTPIVKKSPYNPREDILRKALPPFMNTSNLPSPGLIQYLYTVCSQSLLLILLKRKKLKLLISHSRI